MSLSIGHLLLLLLIIFVLFGAGKLPHVMGDMGRAVRNLRDGLKGEDEDNSDEKRQKQIAGSIEEETPQKNMRKKTRSNKSSAAKDA